MRGEELSVAAARASVIRGSAIAIAHEREYPLGSPDGTYPAVRPGQRNSSPPARFTLLKDSTPDLTFMPRDAPYGAMAPRGVRWAEGGCAGKPVQERDALA